MFCKCFDCNCAFYTFLQNGRTHPRCRTHPVLRYIKRLVVTSLEDITTKKNIFLMVATLNNKMASTDRDYSPFYNSVFSVMAEDRPPIIFVSCTVTSIECNVTR